MDLIEFPEQTVVYAKDQPEYRPLPAHQVGNAEGEIICCWRLTWRERLAVLLRGRIWHHVLTFGHSLQPQLLAAVKPDMGPRVQAPMRKLRDDLHDPSRRLYWAGRHFTAPGIYRWNGERNVRVLRVPRWLARVLPS